MREIYRYFYNLLFRGWMHIYAISVFKYLLCDKHITEYFQFFIVCSTF